jgi:hypothetical protein
MGPETGHEKHLVLNGVESIKNIGQYLLTGSEQKLLRCGGGDEALGSVKVVARVIKEA